MFIRIEDTLVNLDHVVEISFDEQENTLRIKRSLAFADTDTVVTGKEAERTWQRLNFVLESAFMRNMQQ